MQELWDSHSPVGQQALSVARKAAATSLPVLLTGETGVGKEVLARSIHRWSPVHGGPFVPVNCSALPAALAESELFGHLRGAFTSAARSRLGACLLARGGTLFLDEVADLAPETQPKLLRFLENGEVRPVGSDHVQASSARILCATHKPLARLVEQGLFREDLYFRLTSVIIEIPPLRERPEDLASLMDLFALRQRKILSPGARRLLGRHAWSGNVRELKQAIQRAAAFSEAEVLDESDFALRGQTLRTREVLEVPSLDFRIVQQAVMKKALERSGGHRERAAKMMGIARSTFFELLRRYDVGEGGRPGGT